MYKVLETFERIKTYCNSSNGFPYNAYTQSSTKMNEDLNLIDSFIKSAYNLKEELKAWTNR